MHSTGIRLALWLLPSFLGLAMCPHKGHSRCWGQGGFKALNRRRTDWEQKTQKGLLGFSFL